MYQTKIDDGHNIEERSIELLKPYARNARKHSKKQIKQIAASIERFGFTNPVLIGDDESIIAGHGRVEAARRCLQICNVRDRLRRTRIELAGFLGLGMPCPNPPNHRSPDSAFALTGSSRTLGDYR